MKFGAWQSQKINMDKVSAINKIKRKDNLWLRIKPIFSKLKSILEILLVLIIWFLVYSNRKNLGGLSLEEMAAYILIGNLLAFLTGFILERIFAYEISQDDTALIITKPIRYIFQKLFKGFSKFLPSLISLVAFDIVILYFFIENISLNLKISNIIIILLLIGLSFILEFFLAYLLHMFIFWTYEAKEFFVIITHIKKLISGGYFPLSLLPIILLNISLIFPFAYSFFIPTQLLLDKISFDIGIIGIFIQLTWIVILYTIIRIVWKYRLDPKRKKRVS